MNPRLKEKIDRAREFLSDDPNSAIIGELPQGNIKASKFTIEPFEQYYSFLAYCDGGRFGSSLFLNDFTNLEKAQFFTVNLPGQQERWLGIGISSDAPLAIEKTTGDVYLFSLEPGVVDILPEPIGNIGEEGFNLGRFDTFLDYYAFGDGFLILGSANEAWYRMLKNWV